jgi:hypothetical protein
MPKSSKQELETKAEYNKRPDVQKKRVAQNKARRHAIAEGKAKKGDGKDVHHVKPLDKGGSDSDSNTKVVDRKTNRGWRKKNPEMYTKTKGK